MSDRSPLEPLLAGPATLNRSVRITCVAPHRPLPGDRSRLSRQLACEGAGDRLRLDTSRRL